MSFLQFPGSLALIALLAVLIGCSRETPGAPDSAAEWRSVLALKHAGREDAASRQRYADAVHAFLQRYPHHSRAHEVWEELDLEYARELFGRGATDQAIDRLERLIARRGARADEARELLEIVREQRHVTDAELEPVQAGMKAEQVTERLGQPPPGWKRRNGAYESWFYRHERGGIAAIHFRDGRVVAVEPPAASPP